MALDFPTSPNPGEEYGNYYWDATLEVWRAKPLDSAVASTGTTPPVDPKPGDLWYNTIDGTLFVYYYDSNTYQWVEVKANSTLGTTVADRVTAIENTRPNVNYIINGGFDINQRNIISVTNAGTGTTRGFDMWPIYCANGSTVYSAQAVAAGTGPIGYEFKNSVRIAASGQTGTATDRVSLYQTIEDVRTLAGKTATFSFWAKSSTGTPNVSVEAYQYFGTGGSPSADVPGSVANNTVKKISLTGGTSWTRYSATLSIPSIVGKTLGTNNDHYLAIFIWTSAGSNNATRSDSLGSQNNTIDFTGMQLESGTIATPFHRNANSIQGELAACQRYYWRRYSENPYGVFAWGTSISAAVCLYPMQFPVTMRRIPDIDISAVSTFRNWGALTANSTMTGLSILSASAGQADPNTNSVMLQSAGGSAMTSNNPYALTANNNSSAYIGFSAEL